MLFKLSLLVKIKVLGKNNKINLISLITNLIILLTWEIKIS